MFVGLFASVCLSYFITLVEAHLCLFTLTSFFSFSSTYFPWRAFLRTFSIQLYNDDE